MKKKKKFKDDYGVRALYYFYRRTYANAVDGKEFSEIINLFNNKLIEEIYKGAYITLPYSLGDIYITKYKKEYEFDEDGNVITKNKFNMVDYKTTKELWQEHPELKSKQYVYYDNFHTDGYKFRIKWKRYHTVRANKLYNFKPSRSFSRGLAAYLRQNPNQSYYD
jgi:hypothetical protein